MSKASIPVYAKQVKKTETEQKLEILRNFAKSLGFKAQIIRPISDVDRTLIGIINEPLTKYNNKDLVKEIETVKKTRTEKIEKEKQIRLGSNGVRIEGITVRNLASKKKVRYLGESYLEIFVSNSEGQQKRWGFIFQGKKFTSLKHIRTFIRNHTNK